MDNKSANLFNVLGVSKICPNIQDQNLACAIENHDLLTTAKEKRAC